MADDLEMQRGGDAPAPAPSGGGGRGPLGKLKGLFKGKHGALMMAVVAFGLVAAYVLIRMRAGRTPAGAQAGVVASPQGGALQAADPVGMQLEGLQAQISNLGQQISSVNNTPASQASSNTSDAFQVHLLDQYGGQPQWLHADPSYSAANVVAQLNPGATLQGSAGGFVTGGSYTAHGVTSNQWEPVTYNGHTYYLWAPDVRVGAS